MCSQGKIIKEGEFVQIFGNDIQINEQGELTYPCVVEQFTNDSLSEEDTDLLNLLKEFDLEKLFHDLKNAGITFRSLKFLSKEDIAEAIKNIGLRAEFREKLFFWRKSKFGIEDETLSQTSKVVGWLEKTRHNDSPCSSNNSIKSAFGSQPLSTFLKNNLTGKELIQYYEERACFTNKQRDDLIKIISEDVTISKAKLRPEHFTSIVEEIIGLFPKEKESQVL